jgi:uncharacterized protein (TIGR03067 family)
MFIVRTLFFVVALALVGVVGADEKPAKLDPEKLLGKYVDLEGMKAGEKAESARLEGQFVTITKDIIQIEGDKPEQLFKFAYKLNTDKNPVEIDMEIQYPEDLKGNKANGIISLEGNILKLCYHKDNKDRPKKFETTKDDEYFLWIMKKEQKK